MRSLKHRGPDGQGLATYENACICNTRLSIIDIHHGAQPFFSDDRMISVVQNGEIFNFIELRNELKAAGHTFHTNCDTEVILRAYEHFGEKFAQRLNGMFSIAVIDSRKNEMILVRDRLGVKPLFVWQTSSILAFSSEIKAFFSLPGFRRGVNHQAIVSFLSFNYVTHDSTIFNNVRHVQPGTWEKFSIPDGRLIDTQTWWNAFDFAPATLNNHISEDKILDDLDVLVEDATRIRLRSDVPFSAFLSGGIDSSLTCTYARQQSGEQFEIYCMGFHEKRFDESIYAEEVANSLGLRANIHFLTNSGLASWPQVLKSLDQPHGDISFLPLSELCQNCAASYKVTLTGDGADECFGGYLKYRKANDLGIEKYYNQIQLYSTSDLERLLTREFRNEIDLAAPYSLFRTFMNNLPGHYSPLDKALIFDTVHLFPGNNLVKPDMTGMRHGLELRSPFLDYRIFEYVTPLPDTYKIRNGVTKYLLRKLYDRKLGGINAKRPKQMFTVPVGEWFKGHQADFLRSIIQSERLLDRNIFNPEILRQMAQSHIQGTKDFTRELRAVVALELWFRNVVEK